MHNNLSITNQSGTPIPRLPFGLIKKDILGEDYDLSIAFVKGKKSRELNKKYRKKDKPTNVLSFALGKKEGELILAPTVAKKEARKFDRTYREFFGFLVIHGMLHLKGFVHSSKMDIQESKYDQKYFYRNRHRLGDDKSRGGRIRQRARGRTNS